MAGENMLEAGTAPAADPKAADPAAVVADPKAADPKAADPAASVDPKAADPAKPADPKAPEGAPEKYEDFKLPEGLSIAPEDLAGFQTLAKSQNLSQAQAQALVDFQAKYEAAKVKSVTDFWTKQADDWATQAKNHPEFGGAKFSESVKLANETLDRFGTPELRADLSKYGLQNNPHLFALLAKVAQSTKDDKLVTGGNPSASSKSAAATLFPTMANLK